MIIGPASAFDREELLEVHFEIGVPDLLENILVAPPLKRQLSREKCAYKNSCTPSINLRIIIQPVHYFWSLIVVAAHVARNFSEFFEMC